MICIAIDHSLNYDMNGYKCALPLILLLGISQYNTEAQRRNADLQTLPATIRIINESAGSNALSSPTDDAGSSTSARTVVKTVPLFSFLGHLSGTTVDGYIDREGAKRNNTYLWTNRRLDLFAHYRIRRTAFRRSSAVPGLFGGISVGRYRFSGNGVSRTEMGLENLYAGTTLSLVAFRPNVMVNLVSELGFDVGNETALVSNREHHIAVGAGAEIAFATLRIRGDINYAALFGDTSFSEGNHLILSLNPMFDIEAGPGFMSVGVAVTYMTRGTIKTGGLRIPDTEGNLLTAGLNVFYHFKNIHAGITGSNNEFGYTHESLRLRGRNADSHGLSWGVSMQYDAK